MTQFAQDRVAAVLGPTNTGKTYLAIERMLGHSSGMIGFPLRLLARENYDRVVRLKGAQQVALVTGEEKIVPPGARYFLCTVESMPVDRPVAFLAVDEIQLCADPERGHVFTDRLLHARGTEETMFLGAETIRPVLQRLVPEASVLSRPRFSTLSYSGPRKLTRLPPRSAVVAFSAAEVYAIAELMRRQRGGTAVVLGALSPRTRNAQVGMFEAGEVDYLVATDAIGMGLNLSLDHVAFARLGKFDGVSTRRLTPAEMAQIAGRAGRHMADGTFGTTNDVGGLEPELVEAVENHRFDPLHALSWRSRDFDFRSPALLLRSLERRPPRPELMRARDGEDLVALATLARDPRIQEMASHPAAVRLLWEVCQIPDFQKILSDRHAGLLARVYGFLMRDDGRLPEAWVARQIARIDRTDGDIEALVARIADIRTWTFITHRGDWLADATHWQERAREIEDRLSDALHERLTQRFVDRRAATLVRRLSAGAELLAAVKADGAVVVEGEFVGRLHGFRFRPDEATDGGEAKPLLSAARRVLTGEIPGRVRRLEQDPDDAFTLTPEGAISWRGTAVARLGAGDRVLKPSVEPLASEFLDGRARERIRLRLADWLGRLLETELEPLYRLARHEGSGELGGRVRGLVFQLVEGLGVVPRRAVAAQASGLDRPERARLRALGVRVGRESVFLPELLEPAAARLRALLWAAHARAELPPLPPLQARAFVPAPELGEGLCQALGYRRLAAPDGATVAMRADALERLAHEARRLGVQGAFEITPRLERLAGCDADILGTALTALGYRAQRTDGSPPAFHLPRRGRNGAGAPVNDAARRKRAARRLREAESPFAKLRDLTTGKP